MPSRFEFERAIRRSGLPPLARLIALVIASWADVDSGVIARRNQPAQSVLLEATGMSKSAFLAHRKTLLDEGWVKCQSPDRIKAQKEHAQNVYSIHVPAGKAGSPGDLAFPGEVGHAPVSPRSRDDLAQSQKNGTSPDQARSGDDLGLGRQAAQPKADDVGNAPEKLGRQATTRVFPSSTTPSSPAGGEQAGNEAAERQTDAFAICQPLIQAMTDTGLTVSWQMPAEDWLNISRVVQRAGVDAMVTFARGVRTREPVRFARFYLKAGWLGLPPKSTRPQAGQSAERPPYCGDPDCDEITRYREVEDDNGIRDLVACPNCHPSRKEHRAA